MTKKQLDSIKFLYELLKKSGIQNKIVQVKDFKGPMTKAKVTIPWSTINQHKKACGGYQFEALFQTALGIGKDVEMPDSFPVADFADFTKVDAPRPKKKEKVKVNHKPPKKSKEPPPPPSLTKGSKIKHFDRPIFLVEAVDSTGETSVTGITREWDTVWNKLVYRAIHDNGKLEEEKAQDTVDHMGVVIIPSSACNTLYCVVTKMEME